MGLASIWLALAATTTTVAGCSSSSNGSAPPAADAGPAQPGDGGPTADGGPTNPDSGPVNAASCAPANVFLGATILTVVAGADRDNASGDLNNDGMTDIVARDYGHAFTVALSKGNGAFAPAAVYDGVLAGEGIAVGDIDGDGFKDVLYSSHDDATNDAAIAVALNKKDGTFAAPIIFPSPGENAEDIRAVDLNGDKMADVVVGGQNSVGGADLVVMMNIGGGKLAAPVKVNAIVGQLGHSIEAADLDGDGKMDIVTYQGTKGPCVLLGTGDGNFKPQTCYQGSTNILQTEGVSVGDVNGDKKPDIVVTNWDVDHAHNVFLNKGDGTFGDFGTVKMVAGDIPYDGMLADMNNDGKLDIIGYQAKDGYAMVSYGKGDGTFADGVQRFTLGNASLLASMLVGDFLGNGLPSIAAPRRSPTGNGAEEGFDIVPTTCRTTIPNPAPLVGTPAPPKSTCATPKVSFGAKQTTSTSTGLSSRAIDLNGDGKADLLQQRGSNSSQAFAYQLSNGDGTFQTAVEVEASTMGSGIAAGDINGDGLPDVVFPGEAPTGTTGTGIGVAINAGNGKFHNPTAFAILGQTQELSALELVDVNNDGHLDIAADNTLVLGRGDGTFAGVGVPVKFLYTDGSRPYRFADLDGDKQLDVVSLVSAGDGTKIFCTSLNVGNANFGAPVCIPTTANKTATAIAVADVNGDQKMDVVVTNGEADSALFVFLGKGDGTFQDKSTVALPSGNLGLIELADLDNDGKVDALVWSPGQFMLLTGAGNGTFSTTPKTYAGGPSVTTFETSMATGDFAGNGLLGFAMPNGTRAGFDAVLSTCSP